MFGQQVFANRLEVAEGVCEKQIDLNGDTPGIYTLELARNNRLSTAR